MQVSLQMSKVLNGRNNFSYLIDEVKVIVLMVKLPSNEQARNRTFAGL